MMVYSGFFEREVRVNLFTSDYNLRNTHHIISEKFVQAINDFLNLSIEEKPLMESLLYRHCLECCEAASYGFEPLAGETETEANLREFGVKDGQTAFAKAPIDHIELDESTLERNRYVKIIFYPPWEEEHGCELILKNGKLLDFFGETGTYLGQFE